MRSTLTALLALLAACSPAPGVDDSGTAGGSTAGGGSAGGAAGGATAGGSAGGGSAGGGTAVDAGDDGGFNDAGTPDAGPPVFCPDTTACLSSAGLTCWSCWSGRPDAGGAAVDVDVSVLLDESIDVGALTVSGTLVAAPIPLTVRATDIDITGSLRAGTVSAPRTEPLTITLTGAAPGRHLVVTSPGRLQLYGATPTPIFTSLAADADAGATQLSLETPTTWSAGDEVIITPSDHYATSVPYQFRDGGSELAFTERRALAAASGTSLTLSAPLDSTRHGRLDLFFDRGVSLDERAEVANLTRPIRIEGADDVAWRDAGWGAQLRFDGPTQSALVGVAISHVGHRTDPEGFGVYFNRLAPSPTGGPTPVTNTVMQGSVVSDSSYRGVVIEATNGLTFTGNVVTSVVGHAVMLRNGVERVNVIRDNLVSHVRQRPSADEAAGGGSYSCGAAAYLLANPDNTVQHNVAADSEGCGFWLSFAETNRRLDAAVPLSARHVPLRSFDDNVAHSVEGPGIFLGFPISDDNGVPMDGSFVGEQGTSATSVTVLSRNRVWRVAAVRRPAVYVNASLLTLDAPSFADTAFWALRINGGSFNVNDALFVGVTARGSQVYAEPEAIEPMGGPSFMMARASFAGFPGSSADHRGGLLSTKGVLSYPGTERVFDAVTASRFENVDSAMRPVAPFYLAFTWPVHDTLGVLGLAGDWWSEDATYFTEGFACQAVTTDGAANGKRCTVPNGWLELFNFSTTTGATTNPDPDVTLVRATASAPSLGYRTAPHSAYETGLPLPIREVADLRFTGFTAVGPKKFTVAAGTPDGTWAIVRVPYPSTTTFSVVPADIYGAFAPRPPLPMAANLAAVLAGTGEWFFDGSTGTFYLRARPDVNRPFPIPGYQMSYTVTATGPGIP